MAIMHHLKPRMSRTTTLNITVWIWIFSVILSFPNLLYSVTRVETFVNGDHRVICYMEWPDGPMTQSDDEYISTSSIEKRDHRKLRFPLPLISKEDWSSRKKVSNKVSLIQLFLRLTNVLNLKTVHNIKLSLYVGVETQEPTQQRFSQINLPFFLRILQSALIAGLDMVYVRRK
ncbi:tachykinin-like peptides receptor 99D [Caerostris darwini]|uniref:Tachykinin-like peptides receptor 99D n=1 Tax=Caerostris darwini TaxID=1538125 RepID=A0AAV4N6G3_9ARAC|nr:tachykinin-like peptides receptor 99D [Caerostris darwini]